MQCISPVYLPEHHIWAPCTHCRMCKIQRSKEWTLRIMHELNYHKSSSFITLTYSEEHLPIDKSIKKDELQRFFKRLRKGIGGRKIKYYGCGEYGEQEGRAHYHAIIFGVGCAEHVIRIRNERKECLSGPVKEAWPQGFVTMGVVCGATARYVTDYIHKSYNGEMENYYQGRVQPFQMQSQGLGKSYAIDNAEQLMHNLGCTVKGHEVGLPRYYQKKLFSGEWDKYRYVHKAQENNEEIIKKYKEKGVSEEDVFAEEWKAREQRSKTKVALIDMKKREL
ncbi:hypothetical protein ES705_27825 [subsurface metagenome]